MAILTFRTSTYARNVYLYGNTRLVDIPGTPDDYRTATMQYAATHFTREQIDNALAQGWITQDEYDRTMTYTTV